MIVDSICGERWGIGRTWAAMNRLIDCGARNEANGRKTCLMFSEVRSVINKVSMRIRAWLYLAADSIGENRILSRESGSV